jgi:hypothetical protein
VIAMAEEQVDFILRDRFVKVLMGVVILSWLALIFSWNIFKALAVLKPFYLWIGSSILMLIVVYERRVHNAPNAQLTRYAGWTLGPFALFTIFTIIFAIVGILIVISSITYTSAEDAMAELRKREGK